MKKCFMLIGMGVMGTLMYQSIRDGSAKKYINKMEKMMKETYDDIYEEVEDMM